MNTPDHEVNRNTRSVLTRHWIDLTKTSFASRRGILRIGGEIERIGAEARKPMEPSSLEVIDSELKRVDGVTRVHYDLTNWRRTDDGVWELVDQRRLNRDENTGAGDVMGGAAS